MILMLRGLVTLAGLTILASWANAQDEANFRRRMTPTYATNAANRPEFKGNVIFVETRRFVRPAQESPNPGHGHHEFGNAETYFLVGKGMIKLLAAAAVK